ncbi:MAG: hypothetical protein CL811_03485 [Colwelliaceae bacterium]|nr:hypothetical protein [Colwelliaceae bacterium]|tara:strand:+ start:4085 stop:4339 length:255 start_codon:yes stop_codon:yes gene_type:complete
MQAISEREALLERRSNPQVTSELWDQLTLAQKFAASSLTQFGYDLAFIRNGQADSLAVLMCEGKAATITGDGEINTAPQIHIRQ